VIAVLDTLFFMSLTVESGSKSWSRSELNLLGNREVNFMLYSSSVGDFAKQLYEVSDPITLHTGKFKFSCLNWRNRFTVFTRILQCCCPSLVKVITELLTGHQIIK